MPTNNNRLTNRTLGIGVDTSGRTPVPTGSGATPDWVLTGAIVDMWFAGGQYWGMDPSQFTITRATTATGTWSDGHITTFGTGVPVITNNGIAIWQSLTNVLLQSQFAATWTATRTTLTANAVASPLQTTTGATLVEDSSATTTHFTTQSVTKAASALVYTYSVYAKAGARTRGMLQLDDAAGNGATVGFDLSGGQVAYAAAGIGTPFTTLESAITSVGTAGSGGWYRCSLVVTSNTATTIVGNVFLDNGAGTAAQSTSYSGDGASGVSVFGAQLTASVTGANPYVPTTTGAITQNADNIKFTTPTVGGSYTLFLQGTPGMTIASVTNVSLGTIFITDDNQRILMRRSATTGFILNAYTGGTGGNLGISTAWNINVNGKLVVASTAGAQSACFNGGTVATTTLATLPTTPTTIQIGALANATGQWNGNIQRLALWPTVKLSDGMLKSITT